MAEGRAGGNLNERAAEQCVGTGEVRVPSAERPSRLNAVFAGPRGVDSYGGTLGFGS